MKFVNNRVMKKDAMSLVTGQAVYTDDIAPKDALIVKVLRSPHAHAIVKNVKKDIARVKTIQTERKLNINKEA